MTETVLLLTVGGSPPPILSAIRDLRPAFVCFAVTDPLPGVAGSRQEVEGPEGLPQQAGLKPGSWEVVAVPHDDPDGAFIILREALTELKARYPGARVVGDYTGGTKSMSGALLAATVAVPGTVPQVMVGVRPDLRQVAGGTERPRPLDVGWMLAEREAARLRDGWKRFAYAEAAEGFAAILGDVESDSLAPPRARQRLQELRDLSFLFAAWDRFDHAEALRQMNAMPPHLADWLGGWRKPLELICKMQRADPDCMQGPQCLDLWRNAKRRAARGRFDDAVARCYRLIEATGQWLLKTRHGINTSEVAWDKIDPAALERANISPRPGQKDLGGLVATLKLLAALEPNGAMAGFLNTDFPGKKRAGINELRNMLDLRNHSILAHGTKPLAAGDWERFSTFTSVFQKSVLLPELRAAGLPADLPQLPPEPPPGL